MRGIPAFRRERLTPYPDLQSRYFKIAHVGQNNPALSVIEGRLRFRRNAAYPGLQTIGTGSNRLLKFAAVPSALPLKDGFVLCAEGPIGSEFPVRAGFQPLLGGARRLPATLGQTPA